MIIHDAATISKGIHKNIMINDVSRAFFEAECHRTVCIELPNEDRTSQDRSEDNVGMLLKSLSGTRDAAAHFQKEDSKIKRG